MGTLPLLDFLAAGPPVWDDNANAPSRHDGTDSLRVAQATDAELTRIRAGDEAAFAKVYHDSLEILWAFAMRYVQDDAIAKDIVQDTFYSLWLNRTTVEIETTLRAYLFGAVRFRAFAVLSREKRRASLIQAVYHESPFTETHTVPSPTHQPDIHAESAEIRTAVAAAVAALPERQQLAMTLRISQAMTYDEIGAVLGISKVAVAKLMYKAQDRLRIALARFLP